MARSDLLVNLVRAGTQGDQSLFKSTVEAIIAEERAKQHNVLADNLEKQLKIHQKSHTNGHQGSLHRVSELVYEIEPRRHLSDLILPLPVKAACVEFLEEHHRRDLLRSYNLEPRNRLLLVGPPGNGKTSLAEALAAEMYVPMYVVRYEGVVGTYLGETSQRLKRIFEFVSTRQCVLFFDEFDTLGKERGDIHETGEIKRVVSSLLLQVDSLPSHVVIVTATNHAELLDRAVWRRFQLRLGLPPPSVTAIVEWLTRYQEQLPASLGREPTKIAQSLKGLSFAEIEEFGATIRRRYVLSLPNAQLEVILQNCLEQLQQQVSPSDLE